LQGLIGFSSNCRKLSYPIVVLTPNVARLICFSSNHRKLSYPIVVLTPNVARLIGFSSNCRKLSYQIVANYQRGFDYTFVLSVGYIDDEKAFFALLDEGVHIQKTKKP